MMVAVQRPDTSPNTLLTGATPAPPQRELTAAQERAIRTAMQTFVEDDLAFGSGRGLRRWCDRCRVQRPAPGFVAYEDAALCNSCATQFEIARARGLVWTPAEFLHR
jgi:hypothetical protein